MSIRESTHVREPLQQLQINSTNVRSSYVRKAKEIKRIAEVDFVDKDDYALPQKKKKTQATLKKKTTKAKQATKQAVKTKPVVKKGKPVSPPITSTVAPILFPMTEHFPSTVVHNTATEIAMPPPIPPLPNGSNESWINFVDNGGYKLTLDKRGAVKRFVETKRTNPVAVAEGLKFHRLVQGMRTELSNSARDAWDLVLPPNTFENFNFCCLFHMIATPAVTDDSIILVFGPLFRETRDSRVGSSRRRIRYCG